MRRRSEHCCQEEKKEAARTGNIVKYADARKLLEELLYALAGEARKKVDKENQNADDGSQDQNTDDSGKNQNTDARNVEKMKMLKKKPCSNWGRK